MRRTVLALTIVAVVAAGVATWLPSGGSSTAEELARRLTSTDDPDRFSFNHRAGGTRVLDCLLPNRQIAGAVDYDGGFAVLRDAAGTEIARKHPDRVLLHRDLFAEDTFPTTWLELALPTDEELRARLSTTLGTELAGYVLTQGLPPSGRATAVAALDAAERVDPLPATVIDGRRSDGYRITVDEDRFGKTTRTAEERDAPRTDVAPPTIDLWIDQQDRVTRVVVLPAGSERADDAAGGWSIDYETPAPPLDFREPTPVTDVADVAIRRLRPRASTGACDVPL